eukprot:2346158-Pyramimonas_sp.AAC.1
MGHLPKGHPRSLASSVRPWPLSLAAPRSSSFGVGDLGTPNPKTFSSLGGASFHFPRLPPSFRRWRRP